MNISNNERFQGKKILAAVGTANVLKKEAVERVFTHVFPISYVKIVSHHVETEIPAQPIGFQELYSGALKRAQKIRNWCHSFNNSTDSNNNSSKFPDKSLFFQDTPHFSFFIGIEAGLVAYPSIPSSYLAYSLCVIINENNQVSIGTSPGWIYPSSIIKAIINDRKLELAELMTQISGDPKIRNKGGAVGYFSHSFVNRIDLAEWGVKMALIPFLSTEHYFQ
ncbi:inosine/xanthosine triphosphatase [Candidatus Harpocratesius sp.]